MALVLTGSVLLRHAPTAVSDAWCAARLGNDAGRAYGTLPPSLDFTALLQRATPQIASGPEAGLA
jgi:putative acyl-CoA dehydrogenase